MTYVIAAPEMMTAAATDLAGIGSTLAEEHTAAAASTVGLVPAAADEVSAAVAHLFSGYAQDFHGLAGKAAASHAQFVQNLKASAASYTSIEAAIASFMQGLAMDFSNWALSLRPLISDLISIVLVPLVGVGVVVFILLALLISGFQQLLGQQFGL
jgi:hypothetical protein